VTTGAIGFSLQEISEAVRNTLTMITADETAVFMARRDLLARTGTERMSLKHYPAKEELHIQIYVPPEVKSNLFQWLHSLFSSLQPPGS
jgi:hypothetical protein